MKKLTALLTAAVLMAAPVFSAEAAREPFTAIEQMTPNYPLEHHGDAMLYVDAAESMGCGVEVIQHSPERENLVLYGTEVTLEQGKAAAFELEPGDYTIRVTEKATKDGFAPLTSEMKITVDNRDYTALAAYDIYAHITLLTGDDTAKPMESNVSATSSKDADDKETAELDWQMQFAKYDRLRGDFDGDGAITLEDARDVLQYQVMLLTNLEPEVPPTNGQIVACDIDSNGEIGIEDVKAILDCSVASSIGLNYQWKS